MKFALPPVQNRLIQRLPRKERDSFVAECTSIEMALADALHEPGRLARHVYFPTAGFISLIAEIQHSAGLEVGMVGGEDVVGAHVSLGVLQRAGVISHRRGDLIVLDRGKLEAAACGCYTAGEVAYDTLLP